jgi:nitroreductase
MAVKTSSLLTDTHFVELVAAASKAPSSDNMQPWEFRKQDDSIEVFCVGDRLLSIDVEDMFTWISIGAAIENLAIAAEERGLACEIECGDPVQLKGPAAIVRFFAGRNDAKPVTSISERRTNRRPFHPRPLSPQTCLGLADATEGFAAGVYWTNNVSSLRDMASIDIAFSSILLEHVPFFDGLFDAIRFSRRELESERLGMDLKSLEIPPLGFAIARLLKSWKISRIVGRLGIGRIVAKILSSRLEASGALFLITTGRRDPSGYMEAGRAMEALWLEAASRGLSAHPYGVIPQYLTMAELKPDMFLPEHLSVIEGRREQFRSVFTVTEDEFPAIMLRIGYAEEMSPPNDIRLQPRQIIRD